MEIEIVSSLGLLWKKKTVMNISLQVFVGTWVLISLG